MENILLNSSILIVDDSFETLSLLGKILTKHNFNVVPASSGSQAIALARSKKPDLILLDINMPEPDGFMVCETLKKDPETQHIPIIFLTGKTNEDDILKGFQSGALDYIQKPFNQSELLARVRTHLKLVKLQQKSLEHIYLLHQQELELFQKEKEQAESELDFKNKELINMAIQLTKFNKSAERFIYTLNDAITSLEPEQQDKLSCMIRSFSLQLQDDTWNEIELLFLNLHSNFFNNLLAQFPGLTKNELRLCAFLRLNLSIKDIASITMQTEETIKKSRYRLRQKLNMASDENLNGYIMQC